MHFHYHTLEHLRRYIRKRFVGATLHSCFSQNKNELVIELGDGFWRVGCHTPLTYIVPVPEFAKARKNVVELFQEVWGRKLKHVWVIPYERVMIWELESGDELIFKMHGVRANVLLRRQKEIIRLFNQRLEDDWEFVEGAGPFHPELLPDVVEKDEQTILPALRTVSPIYEKQFARRVREIMEKGNPFPEAYQKVVKEAESPEFFIIKEERKIRFLLFPSGPQHSFVRITGIAQALQFFMRIHFQYAAYRKQYSRLKNAVDGPVKKYNKVYQSYLKNIDQLRTDRSPEEVGHILMANLHQIPAGVSSVELDDFYLESKINIKLNPRLNAQENAERYYDKHKQRRAKLTYLEAEIEDIESKLLDAEANAEEFHQLTPPEQLPLGASGFDGTALKKIKLLSKQQRKAENQASKEKFPFRTFQKDGFQIFVGRNSRNNDELSFKFANKSDLWLHAKDVTGSHVIIRHRAGKDLPPAVLEYAAQLAAWYSKRKNDTLVPVQYTPRKYIRKRKGDPPGMVAVDREKVILVEPGRGE